MFEVAVERSGAAIEMLIRANIPPTPDFYELLYTYSSGTNDALNRRVDEVFSQSRPSIEAAEQLCAEFFPPRMGDEQFYATTERVAAGIVTMHDALETASVSAGAYSGILRSAGESLGADVDIQSLRVIAARLLSETSLMRSASEALEARLEASRLDNEALQHDLEKVRRESGLDPLTAIYNRGYFDKLLLKALAEAEAHRQPLSLVMVDIDHFKMFNDRWGHQTGDQVLRLVAITLKECTRDSDTAARFGGEEFVAILPGTDLSGGIVVGNKIRQALETRKLVKRSTNEKLGRITASLGVSTYIPGDTPASLVERADLCLYAAKRAGRNLVVGEAHVVSRIAEQL